MVQYRVNLLSVCVKCTVQSKTVSDALTVQSETVIGVCKIYSEE